jgi:hypothetical protein
LFQLRYARKRSRHSHCQRYAQLRLSQVIDVSLKRTLRGDNFLLADDGFGERKIFVFSTATNVERLCASTVMFMDGTFHSCPSLFCQLYIIHGEFLSETFPAVYALLPNRSAETYSRLFAVLKTVAGAFGLQLSPSSVMLDFEASAIKALEDAFPNSKIGCCLFHFGQSLWRKARSFGLEAPIRENEEAQKWFRRLCALPLVPEQEMDNAYLWIQEEAPQLPNVDKMHDYMVETWIDENARFHKSLWNHFGTERHRTNNCSEGFNSKLNRVVAVKHPNIFKIVEVLQALCRQPCLRNCYLLSSRFA